MRKKAFCRQEFVKDGSLVAKRSVDLYTRCVFLLWLAVTLVVGCKSATPTATPTAEPTSAPTATPTPEPTEETNVGEPLASLDELDEGWNMLEPGSDTICSGGTPYAFFVRPADTDKLLIYLQGGGGCWSGESCDPTERFPYDRVVDAKDHPANADLWGTPGGAGIFELENPENPFAEYSMVYVPYCTGDFHLGNRVTTYEIAATGGDQARKVTIYHKGYVNVTAALKWTFENLEDPQTIFVTGSSAGAVPSPFYTAFVAEQYPEASIAQLGDAAGGFRTDAIPMLLTNWGTLETLPDFPEYRDLSVDNLTLETFYTASGSRYADITFTQYNTAADEAQLLFLSFLGVTDTPLIELLDANLAEINATVDNFRSYTAGGDLHGILPRPEFYTYQADGVRICDWVAALAAGEDVEDVMCTECEGAD